nr:MAG TPA: hypothetical protein [Caudoviricetes sp.]
MILKRPQNIILGDAKRDRKKETRHRVAVDMQFALLMLQNGFAQFTYHENV